MTREEVSKLFATLNRGDVLELTSRITVDGAGYERVRFRRPHDGVESYCYAEDVVNYGINLRVVRRAAIPEPPTDTVVLDCDGAAWQRHTNMWGLAGQVSFKSWRDLWQSHGPLRVIYRPDQEPLAEWEKQLLGRGEDS